MQFPNLTRRLRQALHEDGAFNDVTTRKLPGYDRTLVRAELIAKAHGRFCGEFLLRPLFRMLDPRAQIRIFRLDGQQVRPGEKIAVIKAKAGAVLSGERLYLNLACHLSGIATLTARYVEALRPSRSVVVDTRKTTPLWRDLEKYAVRCGGGQNHRMALNDAVLAKDNHLSYLRKHRLSPGAIFRRRPKGSIRFVEIEAKSLHDVWEGIKADSDIVMLDNMSPHEMKAAMVFVEAARRGLNRKKPLVEVSGGVTLERARALAHLGVDRISVGALTHSAPALDLSLEVY